ncbi:MAG: crossover junction endodeoxyribonuclease RuvC [Gammaproteobacteria bacterium]|nr:crossover junction endodeoxyribonuclease RuvC [Gammaproteobacteria bacterium]
MLRILGIDPGSRYTGFGIIESDGLKSQYIHSGYIKVKGDELPEKLGCIFAELSLVIKEWQPEVMAIEKVFVGKNVDSALKLGQARGAAICAGVSAGLPVGEYTPTTIKKAVVGRGRADKGQIQEIMRIILKLSEKLQADEADALAVALCHAHNNTRLGQLYKQIKTTGAGW